MWSKTHHKLFKASQTSNMSLSMVLGSPSITTLKAHLLVSCKEECSFTQVSNFYLSFCRSFLVLLYIYIYIYIYIVTTWMSPLETPWDVELKGS